MTKVVPFDMLLGLALQATAIDPPDAVLLSSAQFRGMNAIRGHNEAVLYTIEPSEKCDARIVILR